MGSDPLGIQGIALLQSVALLPGSFHRLGDGIEENLMLLFLTLEHQHLILSLAQLFFSGVQLELDLISGPLRFPQFGIRGQQLLL